MRRRLGIISGLLISAVFLYLALHRVDFQKMRIAFKEANYPLLLVAVLTMFLSHWLRALRHRYFLEPIQRIEVGSLFSALMVGYMANTLLPAHLGEFLRAYIIGKKKQISTSSTLATIAIERIVDVFSLLTIMGLTLLVYSFPPWVKTSGYLIFGFALGFLLLLILLKVKAEETLPVLQTLFRPLPRKIADRLLGILRSFLEGVVALKHRSHYPIVVILSILVWACYAGIFLISFYAFDFVVSYHVPPVASFVVLVITTISVVVPSSPGYIGTYHWLCIKALGLFGVPKSPALSFAIVVHGIGMLPVAIVGLFFSWREGLSLSRVAEQRRSERTERKAMVMK